MKKLLLLIISVNFLCVFGQQLTPVQITSGGDSYVGQDIEIDFTLGVISHDSRYEYGITEGLFHPTIKISLRIDELSYDFSVYPNPATDLITIDLGEVNTTSYRIELLDLNGRKVKSISDFSSISKLDISDLEASVYFLNILNENENKMTSYKVVKAAN